MRKPKLTGAACRYRPGRDGQTGFASRGVKAPPVLPIVRSSGGSPPSRITRVADMALRSRARSAMGLPAFSTSARLSRFLGGLILAALGFTNFSNYRIRALVYVGRPEWARTPKRSNEGDNNNPAVKLDDSCPSRRKVVRLNGCCVKKGLSRSGEAIEKWHTASLECSSPLRNLVVAVSGCERSESRPAVAIHLWRHAACRASAQSATARASVRHVAWLSPVRPSETDRAMKQQYVPCIVARWKAHPPWLCSWLLGASTWRIRCGNG